MGITLVQETQVTTGPTRSHAREFAESISTARGIILGLGVSAVVWGGIIALVVFH